MSSRFTMLLPLIILIFSVSLRIIDPSPIERLRLATFDEFQQLHPRVWVDADVRIVDVDDESLERIGQWPWSRMQVAVLVDHLAAQGAAVTAFDIVFAEPDRMSPVRMLPVWAEIVKDPNIAALVDRLPDHDRHLAASLAATRTVLGFQLNHDSPRRRPQTKWAVALGGDDPRPFLPTYSGAVSNLPELEAAATGQGGFNSAIDRDGVIRRVPLILRLRGDGTITDEFYPSLAAEALRIAQGANTYILKTSGGSGQTAFGERTGVTQMRIGRAVVPTDSGGHLWIYDTGHVAKRFIPAWRVFEPGFDATLIEGKIVFVGTSASALKDIRATPLNPAAAGVELHAQAAEQMILGEFLERPDWMVGAEIVWLLVLGLALAVLLPRWGAAWCAVFAGAAVAVAIAASLVAFIEIGWLVDPIYPSMAIVLLYLVQSFTLFLRTEAERSRVRDAFGHYMSPVMVERLARDPSSLRLGGEAREMTILFSDIRGFTSISEKLDAENLTRFLNRFLTPMTDIIMSHQGTIDKYMGDAIMAFWNAPLDDPDHAVHAARAALAMTGRLETLNREWAEEAERDGRIQPVVAIGVGLNTGACSVGNMGSEQRFDYSVLGDPVNLASRLEGQSKTYGVPIIVGEATRAQIEGFACLELDRIRVVGKAQAVRIFALLGDETVTTAPWFHLTSVAQTQMLAAYHAQDWVQAAEAIERVRLAALGRFDGPCDLFMERLGILAANPPPRGWDGVYQAQQK